VPAPSRATAEGDCLPGRRLPGTQADHDAADGEKARAVDEVTSAGTARHL